MDPDRFLARFVEWARGQGDIRAVLLVGSYARGTPRPDSDVDVVVIVDDPGRYTSTPSWAEHFGPVTRHAVEPYGLVTSLRVWYADRLEAEYGFTTTRWAEAPIDAGTARVVSDGARVLLRREAVLEALPLDDLPT